MSLLEANPEFEALLDYLKHNRGCDLTGYKRSTLMRRFGHRMQNLNIDSYQHYLQYLHRHAQEYLALLDDVLINFTSFFRDRDAWDYLASDIIPQIIASKQPDEPIRVWSAGCAAGQEIYSLLILLAETLGIESCLQRVQCYATDADEAALKQARQATYSALEVSSIPRDWLEKYFEQTDQDYVVRPMLRQKIIFGLHDLTQDAPISKIDLLVCRNVLIYFNPEAQASILVRFHFALKKTGFLFLGKSETLVNRKQIFTPVHMKHQIYAKGLKLELEDHLAINPTSRKAPSAKPPTSQTQFWQTAFETNGVAQFAVDLSGCLVGANEQANILFALTLDDWNYPFHELEPGKLIAAHTSVKTLYCHRRPVKLKDIERNTAQGTQYFEVAIAPVLNAKKQLLGSIVTFVDKTECKRLTEQLEYANAQLKRVSEALQATQTKLESAQQEIQILAEDTYRREQRSRGAEE
ncbi:CheR family methyltransferase [Chroococcidiopsis sp. TS-821]|uniref:CheR family methyltransferase n=1 Tax=Chroococcidiopsis sp. TS-821 TaxID=1378066 RepID=UPI000CEEF66E|nr:CheR family methyltransferase [Chroococcidiopsis sp. TS-821]PPS40265.1 chemotaxis protein CheR [Chroococcidiopsis sp. TS-821]